MWLPRISRLLLSILSCEIRDGAEPGTAVVVLDFQFSLARSDLSRGETDEKVIELSILSCEISLLMWNRTNMAWDLSILSCEISGLLGYVMVWFHLSLSILSCEIRAEWYGCGPDAVEPAFNSLLRDQALAEKHMPSPWPHTFQFSLARSVRQQAVCLWFPLEPIRLSILSCEISVRIYFFDFATLDFQFSLARSAVYSTSLMADIVATL